MPEVQNKALECTCRAGGNLTWVGFNLTWKQFFTVTDLANSCANPLFRRAQGSQGCLEKQNHPLSWILVVWCAKIGPKTKKVQKTSELTKKWQK